VLDRRTDKNASTGLFELAYRQPPVPVPPYVGVSLIVEGQLVKKPSGESGAGRKTVSDGGGGLRGAHDVNAQQNRVRCDEPIFSVHKLKSVDVGNASTQRAAQNRTAETKSVNTAATSSGCESRTRQSLVAVDSAIGGRRETLDNIRESEGVRDGQKCGTAVQTRQLGPFRSDSSESDAEPAPAWSTSKAGLKWPVTLKAGTPERRHSIEFVGERPADSPKSPTTTASGRKRHKATRPAAARPRRHRRSKLAGPTAAAPRNATVDELAAQRDHGRHGPERTASTPPPVDTTTTEPRRIRTKPAAATYTAPTPGLASTSRRALLRRTPSFYDVTRKTSTSTVGPSPSIVVLLNDLSGVGVPAESSVGRPRPTRTLLPSMPSFGARMVSASRSFVPPADCIRRHSHDYTAGDLRSMSPISKSVVMNDLRTSMQVIGLGSTT